MTRADFSAIQPYRYEPMTAGARIGDGLNDDEEDDEDDKNSNEDNEGAVCGTCTQSVCKW